MKNRKINGEKVKIFSIDLIYYILGSFFYSVGIICFASPNNIAPGGVSGIATVFNYLWNLPIGTVVLLINIPLLILGWVKIGKEFILKTAIATVVLSVMLDVTVLFLPSYTGDRLLASIFGGIVGGVGQAMFFLRGATSGGTDIIVRTLQRKYPHFSTGRFMLIVDLVVVMLSVIAYKNIESALYAIIYITILSKVIDEVLFGQVNGKVITVITEKEKEISALITENFSRGVTILSVKGGYTQDEKSMIYCAVRKNQAAAIIKAIKVEDPKAFTTIVQADEIVGEFDR